MNIIKNKTISIYLLTLFFFSIFYLYQKHTVSNDSTISEWIINYEGGFTKRGLIGQIAIYLSYIFNLELRLSILIFQIAVIGFYYILLNHFLINLKLNNIIIFSILSPIFILYPVAEIEVLARKETFLYSFFLLYFFLKKDSYRNIYKIIILPLAILIWEPVVFFFPFWFMIDFIERNNKNFLESLLRSAVYYLPAILLAAYIALNPISDQNHLQMVNFLKNTFDENCYMSCELLLSKSSIYDQFHAVIVLFNFERIFRYFLIILFGFGPLIILLKYTKFNKLNSSLISFLVSFPIIILFLMMTDWGRVVNMYYSFSILTYLYLYKNGLIKIEQSIRKNFFIKLIKNKKILIIFFIVFCFGWNPKTSIVGDVGSKPGYQIPRKALKIIYFKYIKNQY